MPKGKKTAEQEQYEKEEKQREEEEKERFKEEWMKDEEDEEPKRFHLSEEQKEGLKTEIKELEESEIRERKLKILGRLETQITESEKSDVEIAELKQQLQTWKAILDNPHWEKILHTYFSVVYGVSQKMCAKLVVTVTETNGEMTFSYEFFDKNGKPVVTEFNDGVKE